MQDMLRMRRVDFEKLNTQPEVIKLGQEWAIKRALLMSWLPEDWNSEPVLFFNEEQDHEKVKLRWFTKLLQELRLPYEYFCDGGADAENYWELYNPSVSPEPEQTVCSKDTGDYLLTKETLMELQGLPAEAFKQAVLQFFEEPFEHYPFLDEIED